MSDDLMLPQVPEAAPDDPEDVSWALSTAEAMWARGDHAEGIKWVRRAAEAASEAENDLRALQLAKAAADLTNVISRMSRVVMDDDIVPVALSAPPPVPPARSGSRAPPFKPPMSSPPKPQPSSVTKQVSTPSRPPAPLPSRTSQPPPPGGAVRSKPLGTNTGRPPSMRPSVPVPKPAEKLGEKKDAKKNARRSRENLDAEARAAFGGAAGGAKRDADTSETAAVEVPVGQNRVKRAGVGNNDPTTVAHANDVVKPDPKRQSIDEWDASPTQDLAGDELAFGAPPASTGEGDRMTAVGRPPPGFLATPQSFMRPSRPPAMTGSSVPSPTPSGPGGFGSPGSSPPATVAGAAMTHGHGQGSSQPTAPTAVSTRPASVAPHDPGILTSQAVRVVVWRDAAGVHVAPAGTVVSAITVDAVLVALEPNADLTAWLSQRNR
jgi:hypothetical protein